MTRIALFALLLLACSWPPSRGGLGEPCRPDGQCDYPNLRCQIVYCAEFDRDCGAAKILGCGFPYCCVLREKHDGGMP